MKRNLKLLVLSKTTYLCDGSGVPGADCLLLVVGLETLESEAERLRDSSSPPEPPLCLRGNKGSQQL